MYCTNLNGEQSPHTPEYRAEVQKDGWDTPIAGGVLIVYLAIENCTDQTLDNISI